jgi:hypothetical protein
MPETFGDRAQLEANRNDEYPTFRLILGRVEYAPQFLLNVSNLLERNPREANDHRVGLPYGGRNLEFPILAGE